MRGQKHPKIIERPGTCGKCVHFIRGHNGEAPTATGRCAVKPDTWWRSQTNRACKTYYHERSASDGTPEN
jgi:hypothetical protein